MRTAFAASLSLHLSFGLMLLTWHYVPTPPQTSAGWMDVVWLPARASQPSGSPRQTGSSAQAGSMNLPAQAHAVNARAPASSAGSASLDRPQPMPTPIPAIDRPPMLSRSANNRPPVYPEAARRAAMQGTVDLEVCVGRNGSPQSVAIAQSSGFPLLDDAARDAVSGWAFKPALHAGLPVVGYTRVGLHFSLVDSG